MSAPYRVAGTFLSAGLVSVSRDGDGLFLDFANQSDQTEALRIALFSGDAQRMLDALKSIVRLLEDPPAPTSTRH